MKNLVIALSLASASAFAADVRINQFSVVRTGGGQMEAVVYANKVGAVLYVKSCNFKDLDVNQQTQTAVYLKGKLQQEASLILANRATLATDQSVTNPNLMSGTWVSMNVSFSYEDWNQTTKTEVREIQKPLIYINGAASNILSDLETLARKQSGNLCQGGQT
ncbi:hypothetical protein K2X33_12035 [bacterium]|nr:hypothetical protein [bacterium]